jgi:hypothetical protein
MLAALSLMADGSSPQPQSSDGARQHGQLSGWSLRSGSGPRSLLGPCHNGRAGAPAGTGGHRPVRRNRSPWPYNSAPRIMQALIRIVTPKDSASWQRAAMARCSTVSFGVCSRPRWWRPASRSLGRRGWGGCARRSWHTGDPLSVGCWLIGGAGHGRASRGRPVMPARPAGCWLPARAGRRRSLTASGGMVGAHGGRAAWSSARRLGVRTSPVRLTSTVIS